MVFKIGRKFLFVYLLLFINNKLRLLFWAKIECYIQMLTIFAKVNILL